MSGRVVVVGSYNQDHVWTTAALPQPGETRTGRYGGGPGGKGFNQAMAAARMGAQTVFIGALGEDTAANYAIDLARDNDIALRVERPHGAATGAAAILVDAQGRNQIVVAPGANALLSAQFIGAQAGLFRDTAVVLAQLEVDAQAVEAALALGRAAGALTLLNPAPADAEVTPAMLAATDLLTPNETEFAALLARLRDERIDADSLHALADTELHALCRRLGVPTVVVTLGAHGCFASHGEHSTLGKPDSCERIPGERVDAVDTTGAGDAFNGALAAALALAPTTAFADHLRQANRYAALSVERPGAALAMPRRDEVQARFGGGA